MKKYETHIGREIKTTAKQHRLKRIWKREQETKFKMAKGAGKDSKKLNVFDPTAQVMDLIKNDPNAQGLLGTREAHIQFGSRDVFDNC